MMEERLKLKDTITNKKLYKKLSKGEWPDNAWRKLLKKQVQIWFKWDWKAKPPVKERQFMLPAEWLVFTHSGHASDECHGTDECFKTLLDIQQRDLDRGLDDIQYNFYIGADGGLYEGRGWHFKSTKDPRYEKFEGKSLDIAYMGDFKDNQPSAKVLKAGITMAKYLYQHRYLDVKFDMIHLGKDEGVEGYPLLGLEEEYNGSRNLEKQEKKLQMKLESIRKKMRKELPDLEKIDG